MVTETLKSNSITNLDTIPWAPAGVAGANAPARLASVDDYLTVTDAKTSGSIYKLLRVSPDIKLKHLFLNVDVAVTTLTGDVGLYYSDATNDGTAAGLQGTVISVAMFASAVALAAIVTPTDYSNESGTYTSALRNQPLWQAAGLTSRPSGMFDICLTTTATNSGAAVLHAEAVFADGTVG